MSRVWVRLEYEESGDCLEFEMSGVPRVGEYLLIGAVVSEILYVTWDVDAMQAQRTYSAIVQVTARASA